MPIPTEQDKLRISLESIREHVNKILAETENLVSAQKGILNQIPDARDLTKVTKEFSEVNMDIGNGAYVINQGIEAGENLLKKILPGIKYR